MGADQSSEKREKVSQNDVHHALEAQRRMYEKRCRELLASQAQAHRQQAVNTQAHNVPHQPTAGTIPGVRHTITSNNGQHASSQQIGVQADACTCINAEVDTSASKPEKMTMNKEAKVIFQKAPSHSTAPAHPAVTLASTAQNSSNNNANYSFANQNGLERNRTPYSLSKKELKNTVQETNRISLYPDLNQNEPSTSASSTSNNNVRNSASVRPRDFVFVDNHGRDEKSRDRSSGDDEVKCTTCGNMFGLYIFNCESGHSSCKACKEAGAACGLCRQRVTDIRNITLEAYVAERKVPCLNKNDGCNLIFKLADMDSHVKECPFKELVCPLNSLTGYCHWRGKLNHLSVHFDNMHAAQRAAEEGKEMHIPNIGTGNKFVYLIVKGNFNFLFHVWVSDSDRMIYMTTQLIGTKFSAQKWTYEVQIYNKREPRRKYQYTDICNAAIENVGEIFKEARCLAMPLTYAMNYVNEGTVCFKFFISKPFQARGNFQNKNQRGRGGKRQN